MLSEFVQNEINESDAFAYVNHDHEELFENKVYQYLKDFRMGSHCEVQRCFERAVQAVVTDYMENRFSNNAPNVRTEVRIALRRIKELGDDPKLLNVMFKLNSDLLDLLVESVSTPSEESLEESHAIQGRSPDLVIIDDPVPIHSVSGVSSLPPSSLSS